MTPPRSSGRGACIPELTIRRNRGQLCLGSRAEAFTLQERHRRSVGDSAFRRSFRGAPLLVGDRAERVSSSATSTEYDSTQLQTIFSIYVLVYPEHYT